MRWSRCRCFPLACAVPPRRLAYASELDPEQRVAFRALLRECGQRATVVVSTHLVEDVGAACTEVAVMNQGKIVFHGTPDELTASGEGTDAAGDAPLERGYSAVLAAARSSAAAWS
jgi:ABC-2 type transport system ATP-binding protein